MPAPPAACPKARIALIQVRGSTAGDACGLGSTRLRIHRQGVALGVRAGGVQRREGVSHRRVRPTLGSTKDKGHKTMR